ncbi:MAG: PD-(D/E)XK nuclease domain-containing protein [Candidatus Midichloria sp.]|nr:PD-(D/E)XK nuclease domain-containing protein [Candidatus Midichloria sp.]
MDKFKMYQSNQESGFGRYDVMFIPKNKHASGILLAFKVAEVLEDLINKAQEASGLDKR